MEILLLPTKESYRKFCIFSIWRVKKWRGHFHLRTSNDFSLHLSFTVFFQLTKPKLFLIAFGFLIGGFSSKKHPQLCIFEKYYWFNHNILLCPISIEEMNKENQKNLSSLPFFLPLYHHLYVKLDFFLPNHFLNLWNFLLKMHSEFDLLLWSH